MKENAKKFEVDSKVVEGGGVLVGLIGLLASMPAVALTGIVVVSSVELYKYMNKGKR